MTFIKHITPALLISIASLPLYSQIKISELTASNSRTSPDEYGDFDNWIERYNLNEQSVSLDGWILRAVTTAMPFKFSSPGTPDSTLTGMNERDPLYLRKLYINQNVPNPFNGRTRIVDTISGQGRVSITLCNILGQEIHKVTSSELMLPGHHTTEFILDDLSSGICFCRIDFVQSNKYRETKTIRMMMME